MLDRYSAPSSFRKPLAVEMEGRSFLQAALEYKHTETLIIFGIAEIIEQKSEDTIDYRTIIAQLASAFAFELLANIETASSASKDERSERDAIGNVKPTISDPLPSRTVVPPVKSSIAATANQSGATLTPGMPETSAPTDGQTASSINSSSSTQPDSAVPIADPAGTTPAPAEETFNSNGSGSTADATGSSSSLASPAQAPNTQEQSQPPPVCKVGMDPEDEEKSARNDKPVESIADDRLGYQLYVQALYDFITSKDTTTPLTISINGPWGSGKSSLMKMLQSQLEPPNVKMWAFMWQGLLWRFRYWSTFPAWLRSTILLRYGSDMTKSNIVQGLAYKTKDLRHPDINALPTGQQYWARIAVKKQPRPAPFQPTVWFNAWKFSQEEQIWAALATEVLNQLQDKYPWPLRLLFWYKLTLKRAQISAALRQVVVNLLPALGLLALSLYSLYLLPFLRSVLPQPVTPAIYGGSALLWLGTLWSLFKASVKAANVNPFKISLKEVLDPPNYEAKIGFIGRFEEDFGRIVSVTTQLASKAWETQKLVIFIDDIDRCRLPQTVNIIEAISLFLDSEQCVFVIGMDPAAIVASIESKYRDLVNKMRRTSPGIVSPGSLFLDKIIQISFNLPRPSKKNIDDLVEEIMHAQDRTRLVMLDPEVSEAGQQARPGDGSMLRSDAGANGAGQPGVNGAGQQATDGRGDAQASGYAPPPPSMDTRDINFEWEDVYEAIVYASNYLKENPRQIKRFINLFLLKTYIANRLNMLTGQSLKPLAVLIAWSMQWPEVTKLLLDENHQVEICDYLADVCKYITADGKWQMKAPISEGGKNVLVSECERVLDELKKRREDEKSSPSHWSHLPWAEWLHDQDFLACLKGLDTEQLWEQIKKEREDVQPENRLNLTHLMRL